MKNSVKIGAVTGIGIYLHWTFLVLIAGIFFFYLLRGNSVTFAIMGVGLTMAVFLCVVLHELGHALMARYYHVPTRDITLYPIGGVARLQHLPEEPIKELWIALAGPLVNVGLALIAYVVLVAKGETVTLETLINPDQGFFGTLLWINAALVAFNLLPAFPMDGGRVLRALLATKLEFSRATEIAANVGQGMAILFGIFGLVQFNPILLFIALFVYIGAQQESKQTMMKALTQGLSVRQAMMTRFQTLSPDDTLNTAIDKLLAGSEHDFPVLSGDHLIGILTRKEMLQALNERGRDARVGDIVSPATNYIQDSASLEEAFALMQSADAAALPVLRNQTLVGMLTLENVGELMMVSTALRKRPAAGRMARPVTEVN